MTGGGAPAALPTGYRTARHRRAESTSLSSLPARSELCSEQQYPV
jgi:hypothetical protein